MKLSVGILALFACLAIAADDPEAKDLPGGAGKDAVAKVCFDCHGAGNFRQLRLSKDEWSDKVADMMDNGANATDQEVAAIIDYLAANFGPDSKINVNTAPFLEIKEVLALTAGETQAFVDYRKQKGPFKAAAELENIPGVPPEKVAAKKEKIVF